MLSTYTSPTSHYHFYSSDTLHNKAFLSQIKLGWYPFLCGYVSSDLIQAQTAFYLEIGSRRSGLRWGSNLTSQAWNITYQLWMNRNDALHDNNNIHILSGLDLLHTAIRQEFSAGLQNLPTVYRRYFTTPLPIILNKSVTYKKRWFLVVRSGRDANSTPDRNDIWYTDKAIRRWIGFSPLLRQTLIWHHHLSTTVPCINTCFLHIFIYSFCFIFYIIFEFPNPTQIVI